MAEGKKNLPGEADIEQEILRIFQTLTPQQQVNAIEAARLMVGINPAKRW